MAVAVGQVVNRWTVLAEVPKRPGTSNRCYLCRCECGVEKVQIGSLLPKSGSCGCGNTHIWKPAELALLAELYPSHSAAEIAVRLQRTKATVFAQAQNLGLRKPPLWPESALALLREKYADTPTEEIATLLQRSPDTVYAMAKRLGLRKSKQYISVESAKKTALRWTCRCGLRAEQGQCGCGKSKPRAPLPEVRICRHGHEVNPMNRLPDGCCRVCARINSAQAKKTARVSRAVIKRVRHLIEMLRPIKERRREAAVGPVVKRERNRLACPNGHPREQRRPGRSDCAACRRIPDKKPLQTRAEKLASKVRWQAKRTALKKGAAVVENVDRRVVYERDKGICGICATPVLPDKFEVDHKRPLARGGDHSYANVQVAHQSCNRKKWANYSEDADHILAVQMSET